MVTVNSIRVRSVSAVLFNISEHCCAIGYALSEFAVQHSKLFLDAFSALLIVALLVMALLKACDHWRALHEGYRAL